MYDMYIIYIHTIYHLFKKTVWRKMQKSPIEVGNPPFLENQCSCTKCP